MSIDFTPEELNFLRALVDNEIEIAKIALANGKDTRELITFLSVIQNKLG